MAFAGRLPGRILSPGQVRPDSTPASHSIGRRLVMSAEDMPRYGMHEPVVARAPIWVRAIVLVSGCAACWALGALIVSLLVD